MKINEPFHLKNFFWNSLFLPNSFECFDKILKSNNSNESSWKAFFLTYNTRFIALAECLWWIHNDRGRHFRYKSTEVAKTLRESKWQAIFDKLYKWSCGLMTRRKTKWKNNRRTFQRTIFNKAYKCFKILQHLFP